MKMSILVRGFLLLALGALVALAATFFYWQTNKQTLAKKVLGLNYQNAACEADSADNLSGQEARSDEIYFVGCGGFF